VASNSEWWQACSISVKIRTLSNIKSVIAWNICCHLVQMNILKLLQ
jgi:hypothetical protein